MLQDNQNMNIWQDALKEKSNESSLSSQQKTLIILGSNQSGKSTLIKLLKTDAQVQIKPTVLFEYSFIKKQILNKEIIHCYQLSNKNQQQIIPSLINKENFSKTKIVICCDLSKGGNAINDLKQWFDIVRKQIESLCREKMNVDQKVKEYSSQTKKLLEGHEDLAQIKPLPIQTIVVGCKYDQFQKEDSQNRKWLSRALRYMAHTNFCHLFYSSNINSTLISQIRNTFNDVMFGSKRTYFSQKDHLKPIFISQGQDTIQSLNIGGTTASLNILDIIKKQINALFPSDEGDSKKQAVNIDITKYSQGRIDALIEERKKQMLKITKGVKDSLGIRAR